MTRHPVWALILLLLPACGDPRISEREPGEPALDAGPGAEPSDRAVRIGLLLPLSGEMAEVGEAHRRGAELAVAELERSGGIEVGGRRRPVALLVEDTPDVPEAALRAARRLINQERVAALVGPVTSTAALTVATQAEQAGVPMISAGASHPKVTGNRRFVFRTVFDDDFQGHAMARFALGDLAARRAAVLYDVANDYSRGIADVFRRAFAEAGGEVVGSETYVGSEEDFRPALGRIRDRRPDVLFLPNYLGVVPAQARQARELGITATLLGCDSWSDKMDISSPAFEGAFYSHHWHPELDLKESRDFIAEYRRVYGEEPITGHALGYEAVRLLLLVLDGAPSLDGEVLRRRLADFEGFRGVSGTISFPGSGNPSKNAVVLTIRDGRRRFHGLIAAGGAAR